MLLVSFPFSILPFPPISMIMINHRIIIGVVHGDLTTSNVLLREGNPQQIVLIDFGLCSQMKVYYYLLLFLFLDHSCIPFNSESISDHSRRERSRFVCTGEGNCFHSS